MHELEATVKQMIAWCVWTCCLLCHKRYTSDAVCMLLPLYSKKQIPI